MIYLILIAIITFLTGIAKRRVGLAMLVAIVSAFVINLWSLDIARLVLETGLTTDLKLAKATIEALAVLIPTMWAISLSFGSSRGVRRSFLEAFLFSVLVVYLLRNSVGNLLILDSKSIEIANLMNQFEKVILTVAGVFSIYDILGKSSD